MVARQTIFLFVVDSFTNLVDYVFHLYLGRALSPGDFAVVETINSALLIIIAAFGVMQPVVARHVAEAEERLRLASGLDALPSRVFFQQYFRGSALLGLLLTVVAWFARGTLARWLNVPSWAVGLTASMVLLTLLRPVVAGMLQGQQRFVAFGLTRTVHAVCRFGSSWLLIVLGAGLAGALAAFPAGSLLALLAGLGFLGLAVWRPGPRLPSHQLRQGLRLAVGAFVAYAAYMALLNSDLVWVNRSFAPGTAGGYATLVVLRRVLALLPGAVIVIMYPRVVAAVTEGQLPDRILWRVAAVVLVSNLLLTGLYAAFGQQIIDLAFGPGYEAVGSFLGWMGVAMLGYSLGAVWLNLYLATRPAPFVLRLLLAAVMQNLLLSIYHVTLAHVVAIFVVGGWILAVGGLLLYRFRLRPQLLAQVET